MKSFRPAKTGVGDILAVFGSQYRKAHKLPIQQLKTMFALQHCRTSTLGGHIDTCDGCGHTQIVYNSCRNRHCPKCQNLNRVKWVDKLSSSLLPVSYFHIVFTIPSELNRLTLVNQKVLYDILFKAASESLLMLGKDPKYLNALTGMVAVLHTWGQTLTEHPHLHTLVPAGGWSDMAQCWKPSRKKFFLPVKVISSVFRGKFLSLLKKANHDKQLKFVGEIESLKLKANFQQLLNTVYEKDWVVNSRKPFKNATHIIKYLGRYSHRVAISNDRIDRIEGNDVVFKWKDYKDHNKRKSMKLSGQEFIRRFLLHILPHRFVKIRYYGILATRNKKKILNRCKSVLWKAVSKSRFEGLTWKEIVKLISGIDMSVCPACNKGKMIPVPMIWQNRAPPLN